MTNKRLGIGKGNKHSEGKESKYNVLGSVPAGLKEKGNPHCLLQKQNNKDWE